MEALNDDALGLILLRVDSHVSLIRAAAVCRRWRGAIVDAVFLRRYRSLHAPAVPGHYHNGSWRQDTGPVFDPSSTSMVDPSHFSLDFLPDGAGPWFVVDSRGSLLLLCDNRSLGFGFPHMVVCEPLTRRFESIPTLAEPMDMACTYLIDGVAIEAGGHISMSNFRVLCLFQSDGVVRNSMLTAGPLWGEPNICHAMPNLDSTISMGRAGGKRYFCINGSTLVELDGSTGDFTSSVFPDIGCLDFNIGMCNFFVTQLQDGKPRIIAVVDITLKVFVRRDNGEWALEKSVFLCKATSVLPGYKLCFFYHHQVILTRGTRFIILSPLVEKTWPYSIDLETMEVKQATDDAGEIMYRSELPWPPDLHAHID
ncbi:hypothetical protein HU200_039914 [Digitaria exilis]|uniref:F-box domain-containing protein n=1 Tax=Digitaria exilis TaxID=1010633 RepID=A0A835BAH6_9POAL|nr:hypothetical protein HU200_039914 [Digitaria exilis]